MGILERTRYRWINSALSRYRSSNTVWDFDLVLTEEIPSQLVREVFDFIIGVECLCFSDVVISAWNYKCIRFDVLSCSTLHMVNVALPILVHRCLPILGMLHVVRGIQRVEAAAVVPSMTYTLEIEFLRFEE